MRSVKVVESGETLIISDLHLSDKYEGSHVNYRENCTRVMNQIKDTLGASPNVTLVIFLGDVIGVNERLTRDRRFLNEVMSFFEFILRATGNPAASLLGNHDMGDFTEFDFLVARGLLTNPSAVDFGGQVRFHFVNYGDEALPLDRVEGLSDVVLVHADMQIPGVTNWYSGDGGINLQEMDHYQDVYMVIAGHIHEPSPEIYYAEMASGESVGLFYPGCPTRVTSSQRYEECWFVKFTLNDEAAVFSAARIQLTPAHELFIEEDDAPLHVAELAKLNKTSLAEILDTVRSPFAMSRDIVGQLKSYKNVDESVKSVAMNYLTAAMEEN